MADITTILSTDRVSDSRAVINANFQSLNNAVLAGAVSDGDKGDITVTGSGTVWTIDTGLSATKIADGTVTNAEFQYLGGVTSDIQTQLNSKQASMGADDNYVTDAQLVVIGNTSGTNTGDNATNTQYSGLAASKANVAGSLTQFIGNTAWRVFYSDSAGDITELALGADGTFLKSNGASSAPTFAVPAGSGNVSKVGTPVDNQVGVWTGDGTLEGATSFTYNGANLQLTGDIGSTGTRITKGWFTDLQVTNAISGSVTGNAATVTTNANLTGHITSTGNATVLGSFTLAQLNTAVSDANIARTDAGNTLVGTQLLSEGASIGLDPSASADGAYSGLTITATSGYSQAFGDVVYLDPTDSRWEACDANAAAGADGDSRGIIGMVVVAGTDGNACTILLQGTVRADTNFPTFTVNNPIYVSETAGDVTQTQPTTTDVVIRVVGFALTADSMFFNPDGAYITHT